MFRQEGLSQGAHRPVQKGALLPSSPPPLLPSLPPFASFPFTALVYLLATRAGTCVSLFVVTLVLRCVLGVLLFVVTPCVALRAGRAADARLVPPHPCRTC